MKATLEINFFSEREIQERILTREIEEDKEFAPIHRRIRKRRIYSNTLTVTMRTRKPENHFAKLISRGNYDFWDHDPGGYLMSVRFAQPDEDLMEQIAKILRGVRRFHILPGNLSLSCQIEQLNPTYPEAEVILKRSCEAIKSKLEHIAQIKLDYDLSTADDQEIPFYSKSEFLRGQKDASSEPPPIERPKGPTSVDRRPYDPEYAAKHDSSERKDDEEHEDNKPETAVRRDYVEPKYPQYSKDYYKNLQKKRYHKKQNFKASYAIAVTAFIIVVICSAYAFDNGWFTMLNNSIKQAANQNILNNTSTNQGTQGTTQSANNVHSFTMSSCTMISNGLGNVKINCPNHDTIGCNANPSPQSGIQNNVTLTITGDQCQVQYQNVQGATINQYLTLVSPISNTSGQNTQVPSVPVQNSQTGAQTTGYDNSMSPCSLTSDSSGNIDVNCYSQGLYHFSNPSIDNLNIDEVRLVWNNSGNYLALDQTTSDEKEYDLGNLVSKETASTPQPSVTTPRMTIPPITILPNSNNQSASQQPNLQDLYSFALKIVNDDREAKGLNPVALSTINSAQNHADDQLSLKYFSHWNSDGVKPYVVYTKLGGRGSVAENDYYTYSYCPTSNCIENTYDPDTEITKGENEMMNNDASSNWGHRNNILDPHHTHVNFGIAYDHDRFYFVENFEDNLVNWQTVGLVGNTLTMIGTMPQGYLLDHIDVFSDPGPKTLTEYDLDNLSPYNAGYYDQGTDVGMIVPKLSGNYYYPECSPGKMTVTSSDGTNQCLDYTTYQNNSANPNSINVSVDVSKWTNSDGLHTIYLNLKDSNGNLVQATSLTLEYLK